MEASAKLWSVSDVVLPRSTGRRTRGQASIRNRFTSREVALHRRTTRTSGNPGDDRWSITASRTLLAACLLSIAGAVPASAQGDGTCANPMIIPFTEGGTSQFQIDTSLSSNNENNACVDSLATGPDIVLSHAVSCVYGVITWSADFDAVVYYRRNDDDSCHAPCFAASTTGHLEFDSNWRMEHDGVECERPFIVVDGLNGAAGTITVTFSEQGTETPVLDWSWGEVKSRYR